MKMKHLCFWMLVAAGIAASPVMAEDAAKITECMRANIPSTLRIQTLEITAQDRSGGERTLKGKVFGTRDDGQLRTMMRIEAPSDLNGASYLVRESKKGDEMYMFLPAINKVRRITGASVDGQLWGTDVTYSDVKQMQNAFSGATTQFERADNFESKPVHVLTFVPSKADASRYNRVRAYVDKATCVALKIEFLEADVVRKEMVSSRANLKKSGTHWYLDEILIRDIKDKTQTRIKILGVTAGDKLSGRYFSPQSFYLGP